MATASSVLAAGATDIAKVIAVLVGGAVVVDTVVSDWVRDQSRRLRKLPVRRPGPTRRDRRP